MGEFFYEHVVGSPCSLNACQKMDRTSVTVALYMQGETGAVLAMGQTGSGKSRVMGTECRRRCAPPACSSCQGPRIAMRSWSPFLSWTE